MNTQKPEARAKGDGSTLDLHSIFFTIQGEGPFAGRRAIFVRLAGCNLQCPGCDTEYTDGRREVSSQSLALEVAELARRHVPMGKPAPLIVLTGGEPLRQTVGPFVQDLVYMGFQVQIESNGVFAPDETLNRALCYDDSVTLVVSPKTKRIHPDADMLATCFKYVLDAGSVDPDDGLPIMALEHPASTGVARPSDRTRPIYLNPYDAKDDQRNAENLRAVATSVMKHGYIAGVQMHKLIGLE